MQSTKIKINIKKSTKHMTNFLSFNSILERPTAFVTMQGI